MQEKIREKIFKLADEKYKQFHSGLCPGTNNIIGVRVPVLRNLAKEIVKEDWKIYLKEAKSEYYEEIMVQGMVIGLAKMDIEEKLKYTKNFVKKIDNWAICDIFCSGLKDTNKNMDRVWTFLQDYLNSKKEFELRFGIVMLLDYYIKDEYIKDVIKIVDNIKHEGYYVKMAVAWAISIAYIKYPELTYEYLQKNKLDEFTLKKSIQKIRESYRVSKQEKEKLKNIAICN